MITGSHLDHLKEIRFHFQPLDDNWNSSRPSESDPFFKCFQVSRWMTTGSHLDHLKAIRFQVFSSQLLDDNWISSRPSESDGFSIQTVR
jgi:hypothetical protein